MMNQPPPAVRWNAPLAVQWNDASRNVRSLHRPLRNKLRKFALIESLAIIHVYLQYLQFDLPLPAYIKADPAFLGAAKREKAVFEWELEVLAKEIILNAP